MPLRENKRPDNNNKDVGDQSDVVEIEDEGCPETTSTEGSSGGNIDDPAAVGGSQKRTINEVTSPITKSDKPKKKKKTDVSGIAKGWDDPDAAIFHPPSSQPIRHPSTSSVSDTGTATKKKSKKPSPKKKKKGTKGTKGTKETYYEPGGLVSEPEGSEVEEVPKYIGSTLASKVKCIVKIELVNEINRRKVAEKGEKKRGPRPTRAVLGDAEEKILIGEVIPRACDILSAQRAWTQLSKKDIARIWNDCFPESIHVDLESVDDTEVTWADYAIGLVTRDVANRLNYLPRAQHVVANLLSKLSQEDHIKRIQSWLGGDNSEEWKDRINKKPPFLYESAFEENWDGKELKGLYMSPPIIHTLAVYYEATVCAEPRSIYDFCERPVRAVVTAIHAVHHTLINSVDTGSYKIVKSSKLSHFSASNWDDEVIAKPQPGGPTHKPITERRDKAIKTLDNSRWQEIAEYSEKTAREYIKNKCKKNKPATTNQEGEGIKFDWGSDSEPLIESDSD
ncbi:hypothetical protein NP233_g1730 [Leucocoprinus birnbaumii]|uniref:Uncharacterized protein n=1 Tax=Leucocoprinus birnbaumii TaxID=56174 RepID=A0AAD5YZG7_9AGAR|nr:hypothetical protein NP233_g1730 [Leucocoprinus birnbaumii]